MSRDRRSAGGRWLAILLAAVVFVMAGCSGSYQSNASAGDYAAAEEPVAAAGSGAGGYSSYDEVAEEEGMALEDAAREEASDEGGEAAAETAASVTEEEKGTGSAETASPEDAAAKLAKKIVYSGDLTIETTEYEKTVEEMKALMQQLSAIVSSSSESDGNSSWYITGSSRHSSRTMMWELRVPSVNFNAFFDGAGQVTGSVRSKNTYSNDLTKKYGDNAVQIESLTIQQENLMRMMESAETIEDMLAIEDRLTDVRTQLKYLNNSNNQIDYDVQYSQVTVYVNEVYEYPTEEPETFVERLQRSLSGSAEGFVEFLQDLLVALIYLFPYLVLLLIILLIVLVLGRKWRAKHPKKERAKKKGKWVKGKVTERQEYVPMRPVGHVPEEPESSAPESASNESGSGEAPSDK